MSSVLINMHVKYHLHTRHAYLLTEATLFRSDPCPPYWMEVTEVAFISLPGVYQELDTLIN